MNVTIKLDDALCREARHQAVDADLSLSGWISALIHERLGKTSVSRVKEASLLDLLGAEEWLEQRVKKAFDGRILPVDVVIAEKCALLHAERPRAFRDGLILATAAAHGLTVVTRNTKDFAGAAVPVVDPWK